VEVRFDGIRMGYLPKRVARFLAPAMDSGAVAVSLKMDGGAWQVNSSTLGELRKLRQDPNRHTPPTCRVHLTFKIDAGTEVASQLAVAQLHDGLDCTRSSMPE
jgi:deferrochelatase/peroxidase EfeB